MRDHRFPRVVKVMMIAILCAAVLFGLGFAVQALWNWLVPMIFGLRTLTYWQAVGVIVLSKLLFGGFGASRGAGGRMRQRMRDRWESMTPEQRETFRQAWRERWGVPPPEPKPTA